MLISSFRRNSLVGRSYHHVFYFLSPAAEVEHRSIDTARSARDARRLVSGERNPARTPTGCGVARIGWASLAVHLIPLFFFRRPFSTLLAFPAGCIARAARTTKKTKRSVLSAAMRMELDEALPRLKRTFFVICASFVCDSASYSHQQQRSMNDEKMRTEPFREG